MAASEDCTGTRARALLAQALSRVPRDARLQAVEVLSSPRSLDGITGRHSQTGLMPSPGRNRAAALTQAPPSPVGALPRSASRAHHHASFPLRRTARTAPRDGALPRPECATL